MGDYNVCTAHNDSWMTPLEIIEALGKFDTDPCDHPDHIAWSRKYVRVRYFENGLTRPWFGRVWLNPPYGRETGKWMHKLSEHGRGTALVFARTDTRWFHDTVWKSATAKRIFFFSHRLKFCTPAGEMLGSAPAPSCLIAYGDKDAKLLQVAERAGLIRGTGINLP